MADAEDTGRTVELALSELREQLPAQADDLRDALPGLEPDRQVTDWGRSERIERLVDRTLYGFLYHYWFRVEVDGIENVPAIGGALLVANHGGALPPDGAMIAKAIAEEHPRPRPVQLATERSYAGIPGVGMLLTKLGAISGHPRTCTGCCSTRSSSCSCSPKGARGARRRSRSATDSARSPVPAGWRRRCVRGCRSSRSRFSGPRRRSRCSLAWGCCGG